MPDPKQLQQTIQQTMTNMERIYRDVDQIAIIAEQLLLGDEKLKAVGDSTFTWDVSMSLYNHELWLYRWFARAYMSQDNDRRVLGFCIHLGSYEPDRVEQIQQAGISLPFVNVSVIESDKSVKGVPRLGIYDALWGAGWYEEQRGTKRGNLVCGEVSEKVKGKTISYFVNLLDLVDEQQVSRLLVEPAQALFAGDERAADEKLTAVLGQAQAS